MDGDVLVLNLARRRDKRDAMCRALATAGVKAEFITAVDGQSLNHDICQDLGHHVFEGWDWSESREESDAAWAQPLPSVQLLRRLAPFYNRQLRWGEVACFLTHRAAWKRVAAGQTWALVLEDDALPLPSLAATVSEMVKELTSTWDVCYL
eukprot:TRINITY_DN56698_c0_g1_i1.p1 TRINITY_DN56698_c0_g1~~TRINITY_DN56698_c0_g1_i1.p1  ORF type:complete len:151 (+),score=36.33 TRINITY_DN56698_c0_g1_i1:38-490(+)